jgi:hypothetical protein
VAVNTLFKREGRRDWKVYSRFYHLYCSRHPTLDEEPRSKFPFRPTGERGWRNGGLVINLGVRIIIMIIIIFVIVG